MIMEKSTEDPLELLGEIKTHHRTSLEDQLLMAWLVDIYKIDNNEIIREMITGTMKPTFHTYITEMTLK